MKGQRDFLSKRIIFENVLQMELFPNMHIYIPTNTCIFMGIDYIFIYLYKNMIILFKMHFKNMLKLEALPRSGKMGSRICYLLLIFRCTFSYFFQFYFSPFPLTFPAQAPSQVNSIQGLALLICHSYSKWFSNEVNTRAWFFTAA